MWRTIASIVAGLVAWAVVVTILNFGLRAAIPGYDAAEATLQFTMAMKVGRLAEAALTSIAAGIVVALIAPTKTWAPWLVGAVILAMFLPVHVKLWNVFPIWYHLAFLVPLAPLVALGGFLARSLEGEPRPARAS
jgi:CDP-diglyceride synthetase